LAIRIASLLLFFLFIFKFLDLAIIEDVAASSDSTPQGSLEKKPLQATTFPNGFEVYSYSVLIYQPSIFSLVKNDNFGGN